MKRTIFCVLIHNLTQFTMAASFIVAILAHDINILWYMQDSIFLFEKEKAFDTLARYVEGSNLVERKVIWFNVNTAYGIGNIMEVH